MTRVFYVPLRKHGGGTDTEKVSAHKVNSGEENSPAAPAGIRTRNLWITSPALLPTSYPTVVEQFSAGTSQASANGATTNAEIEVLLI